MNETCIRIRLLMLHRAAFGFSPEEKARLKGHLSTCEDCHKYSAKLTEEEEFAGLQEINAALESEIAKARRQIEGN